VNRREIDQTTNSLPRPMLANEPEPDVESVLLVRALEEYLAALEAGDRPKREDFLARYPDIADVLAEPLATPSRHLLPRPIF